MNEDIRKIVIGYISEGDYEKALSLLRNFPLEDDVDKELLESCKKEFTASCMTTITEAAKTKDKQRAERILSSYKKLIDEDANATLFQTLIDGIQPVVAPKQDEPVPQKPTFNISSFYENSGPDPSFLRSKVMRVGYILLAITIIASGCLCTSSLTLCIASALVAISLALPTLSSHNNRFKLIGLVLLIIPIISTIALFGEGLEHVSSPRTKLALPSLPWMASFIFVAIYNALLKNKSWIFRTFTSLLLFTILNPQWYGMKVPFGLKEYQRSYYFVSLRFSQETNLAIILATISTLIVYYCSFVGIEFHKIWNKIKIYKKRIGIAVASILGIFIIIIVVINIKESHDRKIAHQQAIEQARQDSIQAVEDARIAAIEQARQDSIDTVRILEQMRRDSIDYAEHAEFVKKYANIGLIISNLEMTRGYNNDGVGTKGIKFTVFNPTHKTIKYVIVDAHAVNQFNDRVSYNERCRGMGPVEPHEFGSWDFDDVFTDKNDIIDDLSVSFQVIYTNGSSKTIRLKDAYVSYFKTSWFYNR